MFVVKEKLARNKSFPLKTQKQSLYLWISVQADAVSTDGATPLFNSCSSGSAACVMLILQHSASIHTTYHLTSPIHEAAKKSEVLLTSVLKVKSVIYDTDFDAVLFVHQITESVWSCCCHMELILTWSCR